MKYVSIPIKNSRKIVFNLLLIAGLSLQSGQTIGAEPGETMPYQQIQGFPIISQIKLFDNGLENKTLMQCIKRSKLDKNTYIVDEVNNRINFTCSMMEWKAFLEDNSMWGSEEAAWLARDLLGNGKHVGQNFLAQSCSLTQSFSVIFPDYLPYTMSISENARTDLRKIDPIHIDFLYDPEKFKETKIKYDISHNQKDILFTMPENDPSKLFCEVMNKYNGFVIGDTNHQDYFPKYLLAKSMNDLKKQGLKVIFLEHFMESQQNDINYFLETGKITPALRSYIKFLESTQYIGFLDILISAKNHGVKVIASESYNSYYIRPDPFHNSCSIVDSDRVNVGTYVMYEKIKKMCNEEKEAKWIGFIGSGHVCTKTGLDSLLGVPGINLIESNRTNEIQHNTNSVKTQIWVSGTAEGKPTLEKELQ